MDFPHIHEDNGRLEDEPLCDIPRLSRKYQDKDVYSESLYMPDLKDNQSSVYIQVGNFHMDYQNTLANRNKHRLNSVLYKKHLYHKVMGHKGSTVLPVRQF